MAKLNITTAEAMAEIRNLISEIENLKKTSKTMSTTTSKNFSSIETSIESLRNKVGLLSNKLNYLQAIIKNNTTANTQNKNSLNANTTASNQNATAKNNVAKSTDSATKSTKGFDLSIKNIVKGGFLLKLLNMLKELAYDTYNNIQTFDSLSFTLEKITKNSFDYENSQRFLLRITKAYGVELVTTTKRWSRFLAAAQESGLALRDAENIFESMTKASAALGLQTDELTSVYLALEQMLSKGKVSTEELRRQLGERLPGAMGIMAASMGVTIPVLDKMLKKGEVLSAEVLPDFARAVERAYGIENADRIDTLVSKQNRLTAAWQTFIKNVTEGDSVIKKVIGGFIDLLTKAAESYDYLFSSTDQKLRVDISLKEGQFEKELEKSSADYIDAVSEMSEKEVTLKIKEKQFLEQLKTVSGEEIKIVEEGLDEIARIRSAKDKKALENSKIIAKQNIDVVYQEYLEVKKIYEDISNLPQKSTVTKNQGGRKVSAEVGVGSTEAERNKAYSDLAQVEAKYNVLRKLIQESDVNIIDDDEAEKSQVVLRKIRDYYFETMIEISDMVKKSNLSIFNDDTQDLKVRLNAMKKVVQQEVFERETSLKIQQRDAEESYKKEIESLEKSLAEGKLSREKFNEQSKALEVEKNDFLRYQTQKVTGDIIEINRKAAREIRNLSNTENAESEVGGATDFFNLRIIAAKKEYAASKKTTEDKIKLEEELAQAAIDSTNAIIDVKKRLLEQEIEILRRSGDENGEYIEKLRQQINSLEASKQIQPPLDKEQWREAFQDVLGLSQEFIGSIGDLFDAQFERKIENIEAEIAAEEYKYDKLIALAKDDAEQQATLERNKEDAIKKLEAKKLKEKQKQAKANKAFAIAEIAINTAVALIRAYSDTGPIAGSVFAAIIAAIGASQIATVLAQPIPQYKDGAENLSKNHKGLINDGSFKEYIERNGRILSTDKKNAVVDLKKGDTIYKNYDQMASRSSLFKIKNIQALNKGRDDKFLEDVTDRVIDGIGRAKINNHLKITQSQDNSSYRREMSRWT